MPFSTIIRTKEDQVIEIPESNAFPDHVKNVEITRQGTGLLVTPIDEDGNATKHSSECHEDSD